MGFPVLVKAASGVYYLSTVWAGTVGLGSVAGKLDQGGAGAILGPPPLPDYKPGRSNK